MSDIDLLYSDVIKSTRKVLEEEIRPIVFKVLYKHIREDIYDAYTPRENGWVAYNPNTGGWKFGVTYQRRYGLLDTKNQYSAVTFSTAGTFITATLFATVEEYVSPFPRRHKFQYRGKGAFLRLLENGRLGIFTRARFGGQPFPRPAVSNTAQDLENNQEIKAAIERAYSRLIG